MRLDEAERGQGTDRGRIILRNIEMMKRTRHCCAGRVDGRASQNGYFTFLHHRQRESCCFAETVEYPDVLQR